MTLPTIGSAALAALLLAADLVLLVLFLNPVSPGHEAAALLVALFFPYLLAGTAALALFAQAAALVLGRPRLTPNVIGQPWFTSMAFVSASLAAGLFWLNATAYRDSIALESLRGLRVAALGVTGAAVSLLVLGVHSFVWPRQGRGTRAALIVLTAAAAVIVPLALRPAPAAPPRPMPLATETVRPVRRITLVGIDGLGPERLQSGIARDHLPGFARLWKRGAHGPLATIPAAEGPPIWTTIFTGRLPRDHGVKSFSNYRLRGSDTVYDLLPKGAGVGLLERAGLVSTRPVTSASRRRRALWNELNAFGIQTGIVRFWGTYPTEHVQGFMLSPYFHLWSHDRARAVEALYPPDLIKEVAARAVEPKDVDRATISQFMDLSPDTPGDAARWRRDLVQRALAPDLTYDRAGAVLRAAYNPPFFATYFYGLDVVGHAFTRYAEPERFGNVRSQDVRKYGQVVDRYTAFLSQRVGEMAQGLGPGEVLLVVSGYGMEPTPLWRRLAQFLTRDPPMSGTHAGAPDGVIMAMGDGVKAGVVLRSASVLDVAPTVLYLMGLPVARDMEGRVLTEMLEDDFAHAHPVTYIPSYESLAVTPLTGSPDSAPLPPLPEEGG